MKTILPACLMAFLLLTSAPASASDGSDLVTTAVADGRFTTLVKAVEAAGLVEALQAPGPLTVFAPTDEAFAALPAGALKGLLRDRDALRGLLLRHVVKGRVLSKNLLPVRSARTLGGDDLAVGLRIGRANVIQADVMTTNGVIHVIDRVLIPTLTPGKPVAKKERPMTARTTRMDPSKVIHAALDRGVPMYNHGDVAGCARVYHEAAQRLMDAGESVGAWDRMTLAAAMQKPAADASKQAWNLRHAFDSILANANFKPRMEAALPKGFPQPGPVGRIVEKRYPQYRAARAQGGQMAFWTLFQHIKKNKVEMTAPVEMTMDGKMRARDMAFLYERPDQGKAGAQGRVAVLDLEPITVLSIGMRGRRSMSDMATAKRLIEEHIAKNGYERAGDFRAMGYNSPMVPASQQFWELQVPVTR
ncbi:MAG: heme-binding protein [Planctomycetota bacterium]|nr:heme-binding protein [Planctomycetota bacterium]